MAEPGEDLDLFDDSDGGGTPGEGTEGGDADGLPAGQDPKAGTADSKRISDLTSKWQKAEARAKAAEAKLKPETPPTGAGEGSAPSAVPPEIAQWLETARDGARERIYNMDPRFAEYGVEQALIDGDSPDAMRQNQSRVKAVIDVVETKVRNKVLAEHGLTPAASGSTAPKLGDISSMDSKEFEALVSRAKTGQLIG